MTSIIIPTLNASRQLGNLLKSLRHQTIPCEILVIDSSSADDTARIAEADGVKVMTVKRAEFDHGGSRTLAAAEAKSDIVVFITQDAIPVNEYAVEKLLGPFADEKIGAAHGRQVALPDASPFAVHSRLFNYPESSSVRSFDDRHTYGIKTPFLSNAFAAYRKSAMDEIGWFRRGLISTEDTYAGARLLAAGYKLAYVSDATVYHSHNYSVVEEFRRYFDIGVFHKNEAWISETFGNAGGEGLRYLRSELKFLMQKGKFYLFPEFCIRNGMKFVGYHLGLHHPKLPMSIIKRLSRNPQWWNKIF